jgi:hypothetical protein
MRPRRSATRLDGQVLPIEVNFRRRVAEADLKGLRLFQARFRCPLAIVVTRELNRWEPETRSLFIPLQNFLLAF